MNYIAPTTHGYEKEWKEGDVGFNYYDGIQGTVMEDADSDGWFRVKQDDGSIKVLNSERFVTLEVAKKFRHLV